MTSDVNGLDLNLLVTLDALLTERSVTRAAKRLGLAQSSVSTQLARLRTLLGDPLLLPEARGVRPTARAEALCVPLRDALAALAHAIQPAVFDPSRASATFRVAATDYAELAILAPALGQLRGDAPGIRLAVLQPDPPHGASLLADGQWDLWFHTREDAPHELRAAPLYRERYVLVGRAGHPSLRGRVTLERFCALDHIVVSPDGGGFVGPTDRVLAAHGRSRRVALSVPRFLSALELVRSTDLVAMLPSRLVARRPGVRVAKAPLEIPGFEMVMLWHERLHRDPAHRWLRERIAKATKSRRA